VYLKNKGCSRSSWCARVSEPGNRVMLVQGVVDTSSISRLGSNFMVLVDIYRASCRDKDYQPRNSIQINLLSKWRWNFSQVGFVCCRPCFRLGHQQLCILVSYLSRGGHYYRHITTKITDLKFKFYNTVSIYPVAYAYPRVVPKSQQARCLAPCPLLWVLGFPKPSGNVTHHARHAPVISSVPSH
jgi:hypothetical protein